MPKAEPTWHAVRVNVTHRLNRAQRIVVVIGLGVALGFFGGWVTALGSVSGAFGWTGYAPLRVATFGPESGLHPWVRLVIWLALTVVWAGTSIILLRSPSEP